MRLTEFMATRAARIWGRRFRAGDTITAQFIGPGSYKDWVATHMGEGGPWGAGGYRSSSIERYFSPTARTLLSYPCG
jgi:hypothetical protein